MAMTKEMAEAAAKGSQSAHMRSNADGAWIEIQRKTFTNWANSKLKAAGKPEVTDLTEEMKSGVCLCQLLEAVSGKKVGRFSNPPKLPFHQIENLNVAFAFMKKEDLTLVNLGSEDIHKGNDKLVLGLMWTIIYKYQVSATFKNAPAVHGKKGGAKDLLLEWVRSKIPEYDIKGFGYSDWGDGRAFCALTNAVAGEPWVIPNHREMHPESAKRNAQTALDTAEETLGVPKVLSAEDIANPALDDLSVMTYVSSFRTATRKGNADQLAPAMAAVEVKDEPEPEPEPEPVKEKAVGKQQPPPWERANDWRKYDKEDLGGRCKIKLYFSTTTSSMKTRKNMEELTRLFERYEVVGRPDFVADPVDLMEKPLRDKIFERAGTRDLPMLFVDDEFIGSAEQIFEMNEDHRLREVLDY